MLKWLTRLIGDSTERELRKLQPIVEQVNALEPEFQALTDAELRAKTDEFKERLADGETLDELLPEAFAAVREAARRTIGLRHYDVQLMGGAVLHAGKIAEMKTGEGKTLVATLPLYLNALEGKGVHLVTVNDYLAKRDAQWMGPVYHALGLSVGVIQHEAAFRFDPDFDSGVPAWRRLRPCSHRREAYLADITYGTNNEFGFDYLRDNMVWDLDQMVQRELHYAIVDEVDNILIDEARTPLIISGPAEESTDYYRVFAAIVPRLRRDEDYTVDEKTRSVAITESGIDKVERALGLKDLYAYENYHLVHYLENALKAHVLYKRDHQYVVKDGEIVIVDEFTGRLMPGRRYSEGLHQAIEAKEGVRVQRENVTLARITFQNYFRLYHKLAGMTGTAKTEEDEFRKIYNLDVIPIPTHRPMIRQDLPDLVFKTEAAKYRAVVAEIEELYRAGRPVLVGTTSIEKSEMLSQMLHRRGIPHQVLNAKHHEREAAIIAQAGRPGTVTIATNMAGRGVDILLGGNPAGLVEEFLGKRASKDGREPSPDEVAEALRKAEEQCRADREKVLALGGLHIIGTERHEARRIDNQLRGRAGRQGDPGSSRFYLSLEDELMRRFGGQNIQSLMDRFGLEEDVPLEHAWVTKAIENAQTKVEGYNFDLRKHVVEYDDVMNKQREIFYQDRRRVLTLANPKEIVYDWIAEEIEAAVADHYQGEHPDAWDREGLVRQLRGTIALPPDFGPDDLEGLNAEEAAARLIELAQEAYDAKEREFEQVLGPESMRRIERQAILSVMDRLWIQHLTAIDDLREGIGFRAYGQRDPLVEYKREAADYFAALQEAIRHEVVFTLFHLQIRREAPPPIRRPQPQQLLFRGGSETRGAATATRAARRTEKVGRNDPCPCGSGKKYKKCHGQ